MQIAVQPPSKTVYQRILKPFPSVYLIVPAANDQGTSVRFLFGSTTFSLNAMQLQGGRIS